MTSSTRPQRADSASELELLEHGAGPSKPSQGMVPGRGRRRFKVERVFMRLVATGGVIGIDVAVGAILVDQAVTGWLVGLIVGLISVILAALLWSSREL